MYIFRFKILNHFLNKNIIIHIYIYILNYFVIIDPNRTINNME